MREVPVVILEPAGIIGSCTTTCLDSGIRHDSTPDTIWGTESSLKSVSRCFIEPNIAKSHFKCPSISNITTKLLLLFFTVFKHVRNKICYIRIDTFQRKCKKEKKKSKHLPAPRRKLKPSPFLKTFSRTLTETESSPESDRWRVSVGVKSSGYETGVFLRCWERGTDSARLSVATGSESTNRHTLADTPRLNNSLLKDPQAKAPLGCAAVALNKSTE